jgi:hypothetical protein
MPVKESKNWPNATVTAIETHANRLGNLVLLQADVNTQIDRDDFGAKKKAYAKSAYLLTTQVATASKWDTEEIEKRQLCLSGLAVKTWTIA